MGYRYLRNASTHTDCATRNTQWSVSSIESLMLVTCQSNFLIKCSVDSTLSFEQRYVVHVTSHVVPVTYSSAMSQIIFLARTNENTTNLKADIYSHIAGSKHEVNFYPKRQENSHKAHYFSYDFSSFDRIGSSCVILTGILPETMTSTKQFSFP